MEDPIPCTHFRNVMTTMLDLRLAGKPSNPSTGLRFYADIATGKIGVINSSGDSALPSAVLAPGSDVDGGTY